MNTGSGKTVVGLLILKSCLNEKRGPAIYVAPDNYLVEQILAEAKNLGIETEKSEQSPRFLSGKAILVINIYKLINGKSVFGVGDEGIKLSIGSLLIDDAHACLDTIEKQFTLVISNDNVAYNEIFNNFRESLSKQCKAKITEIESGEPSAYMQVPFWTWQDKEQEIINILIKYKESNNQIKFAWPLLKESLKLCRCVISAKEIEISPHCIPIQMIPSLVMAKRKIFMTATLADDGILSTHFGITEESINQAIVPSSAGDIGDRMILLPQAINPKISDEEVKQFCKTVSQNLNVVVIVPSEYRARFWQEEADLVLSKENVYEGIEQLKSKKVGLVVLVNRYDGIDLPQEACRFLIIDGIPDVRRQIDKINRGNYLISKTIQRIEQGMGRGIRSNDDYCVVFLMGKDITEELYQAVDKFSPATKAQWSLSENLSDQIKRGNLEEIREVISLCLERKQDWVEISKGVVASLTYDMKPADPVAITIRNAYDLATQKNYQEAAQRLNDLVNATGDSDGDLKGYLMQCLSEYINFYDPTEAQKTLKSANSKNARLPIKPLEGITYHKLESPVMEQARACSEHLKTRYKNPNEIIIKINGLLEYLLFKPDTANLFEESMKNLAQYLGFNSQRPEADSNRGPDVLWATGELNYFVIECKNGTTTEKINKHDCNQLNGSIEWFKQEYDSTCQYTPILIHHSSIPEYAAALNNKTRIITPDKLNKLKDNILKFIQAICTENNISNIVKIKEMLIYYKLQPQEFIINFTTSPTER